MKSISSGPSAGPLVDFSSTDMYDMTYNNVKSKLDAQFEDILKKLQAQGTPGPTTGTIGPDATTPTTAASAVTQQKSTSMPTDLLTYSGIFSNLFNKKNANSLFGNGLFGSPDNTTASSSNSLFF